MNYRIHIIKTAQVIHVFSIYCEIHAYILQCKRIIRKALLLVGRYGPQVVGFTELSYLDTILSELH